MRIAVYSRGLGSDQLEGIKLILQEFSNNNIKPVIYQDFFNQFYCSLSYQHTISTFNKPDDLENIDYIISLGGDGTLLDAVTFAANRDIPIIGVNYGRLGFLANISHNQISEIIKALLQHTFVIDRRTLIHLDANIPLFNGMPYGLNEFVIHKKDSSPMIKIHTYLNGEFLNTYWADGLIVATPTGSTGYSLSCNGPILFPESKSFVITPVSPHNLNIRPIVVPDQSVVSFEVEGRTDGFQCTLDSRREIAPIESLLAIKKESFHISLVRLSENNFLQTLRNKLSWGLDKRN
ncbi:MAG: NAD kinase [Chitinophagaceae bacterium]|nr:NAD kinase [Chitinophagaceae bacterium]